jgi:SAM-dependent methyltransferase
MIREMWNAKFSRGGYLYGTRPNAFLSRHIDAMAPGTSLLLLGEGEGRNACYAASRGIEATALDASDIGLQKAEALAAEQGGSITTLHADLATWEPDARYDAVMTSFLHLPEPLRTRAFRTALKALKPGGLFVGEFFSTAQLPLTSGGPKEIALLYTIESLRKIFDLSGCEILTLDACVTHLDEGQGHQGDAEVIRIEVRR